MDGVGVKKGGWKRRERGERREKENMRESDAQEEGRTERKNKERDILSEGAIKRLVRNMALGKFPGIHKDDPS